VRKGDVDASALAKHNLAHGGVPNEYTFRVLRRGGGFVMRKCHEALHVHACQPEINRCAPDLGVVPT
jgi:hypothetical protein